MVRVAPRLGVLIAAFLFGCDSAPGSLVSSGQTEPIEISSATSSTSLPMHMLVQEKLQMTPSSAVTRARNVRWRSSNNAVARVNSIGVVEGVAEGPVTITVSGGAVSEDYPVIVGKVASVEIPVTKSQLTLGEKFSLHAVAKNANGDVLDLRKSAEWSVVAGSAVTVSSTGEIIAVATGSATVAATAAGQTGAAVFTVTGGPQSPDGPTVTAFSLAPGAASVQVGATLQFNSTATWSDGVPRPVEVTFSTTGGTINLAGLFNAGTVAGTFSVIATCACGRADTAQVTVLPSNAPATLTSLSLMPSSVDLPTSGAQQFTIHASWSDGIDRVASVSFSVDGGSINTTGLYTAPSSPGTYRVVVSHTGGSLKDTTVVVVSAPVTGNGPTYIAPNLPAAFVNTSYPALTGVSRRVNAGGNLQAALDAAQPGDEVVLANGATFTGNYTLPVKSGNGWIVVRADNVPVGAGQRMQPASATNLPKIVAPNVEPAIATAPGAKRWRLVGLEVMPSSSPNIHYGLVRLGLGNETTLAQQPSEIVLDRMYVHGLPNDQLQRCVTFNGSFLAVIDSWLSDCHGKGFDSQGIVGWNGPGPFLIENNHIEGAGQNIMFGGADPKIANLTPSDITIRRNHLYKPMSWANGKFTVKATFELKHGRRVLFEGNVLENHWADAQVGYAILLQTLSDDNTAWAWSTVSDIVIQNNVVKNSRSGINVLARVAYGGPMPTNPSTRILVRNNLFENIGRDPSSGAEGIAVQLLADLRDMTVLNNTFTLNGTAKTAVMFGGTPGQQRTTIVNNVFQKTDYGIFGDGVGVGNNAITTFASGATVKANVFPGQASHIYPSGNFFPSEFTSLLFASPLTGNYSLTSANPFYQSIFGRVGVDNSELQAAVAGVAN